MEYHHINVLIHQNYKYQKGKNITANTIDGSEYNLSWSDALSTFNVSKQSKSKNGNNPVMNWLQPINTTSAIHVQIMNR